MSRAVKHDVRTAISLVSSSRQPRLRNFQPRNELVSSPSSSPQPRIRASRWFNASHNDTVATRHGRTTLRYSSTSTTSKDGCAEGVAAPKPPLTIVFTDIVKSTALWEKDSDSMNEAMHIHDTLMRNLSAKYAGYEVKQNGDGFMFAFQSAICALDFCLDVQVQLQEQKWPKAFLKLKSAEPVVGINPDSDDSEEIILWKGFRLRMSAHYGEPVCKWNDVIGRMDYLGPAVNRAARFVSVCEGGQIVVSKEFLDELKKAKQQIAGNGGPLFEPGEDNMHKQELDLKELQYEDMVEEMSDTKFEVRMLGNRHFKGVPEKQELFFILPKSLRGRIAYLDRHKYVQPSKGNLTNGE